MGKTYADIYRVLGKEENISVASEVRSTDFIQIFMERITRLSVSLLD
jgi:inosine-uridine nucleoside N-ribohydrolase